MSAPRHCPCCGADTGGEYPPSALLTLGLAPNQRAIVKQLVDAYPVGVAWPDLADATGFDRFTKDPDKKVRQMRTRMKHRLASLGWATQSRKGMVSLVRV